MTQPQLYTIIALVIAVSGATYAAIYALRNFLRSKVDKAVDSIEEYITPIRDSRNEPLQDLAEAKYKAAHRWICCWTWAFGIPVCLFIFVAYWLAGHLFFGCFDNPQETIGPWWSIYRWVLFVLVCIDGICILLTFFSFWRINVNVRELEKVLKGVSKSSIV